MYKFLFFIPIYKGQRRSEIALYLFLWLLLFAVPVIGMHFASQPAAATAVAQHDWSQVFKAWKLLGMFAAVFWIHNIFLAPLLVYRNCKWTYLGLTALLFSLFTFYQFTKRPHDAPGPRPVPVENREPRTPPNRLWRMGERDAHRPRPDGMRRKPAPKHIGKDGEHPDAPMAFGGEDTVALIIMLLLLGLNVGAKYFFKSIDDRKRLEELERENLTNQLEYLKYQINPHFFMNTLNNIHALVDIDPEQAKQTIEVLSKLMRYMLYDGNKRMALLKQELAFIDNYVRLMRIRYNENVSIDVRIPGDVPDVQIPPLLFIIFVENAFKHGISYERPSFIEIEVRLTDSSEVHFLCRNSRKPSAEDVHGGIGLANARKRLELLYGSDYTLDIKPTPEEYTVRLVLPIR